MDSTGTEKIKEETEAWNRYHALTIYGPLGECMYVIQLNHVMKALKLFGLDTKHHLLILRTENALLSLSDTYRTILKFLDLPEVDMPHI